MQRDATSRDTKPRSEADSTIFTIHHIVMLTLNEDASPIGHISLCRQRTLNTQ
jgi:hypothetical protein